MKTYPFCIHGLVVAGANSGSPEPTQGAGGRLAVIAEQGDGLVEQLTFVVEASLGILPPHFDQHFLFGLVTHIVVHVG